MRLDEVPSIPGVDVALLSDDADDGASSANPAGAARPHLPEVPPSVQTRAEAGYTPLSAKTGSAIKPSWSSEAKVTFSTTAGTYVVAKDNNIDCTENRHQYWNDTAKLLGVLGLVACVGML